MVVRKLEPDSHSGLCLDLELFDVEAGCGLRSMQIALHVFASQVSISLESPGLSYRMRSCGAHGTAKVQEFPEASEQPQPGAARHGMGRTVSFFLGIRHIASS